MKVVLYSNENQECERVKQLLKSVKGEFLEYFLDEDFTQQQFDMEFGGDASYPQIQIPIQSRYARRKSLPSARSSS